MLSSVNEFYFYSVSIDTASMGTEDPGIMGKDREMDGGKKEVKRITQLRVEAKDQQPLKRSTQVPQSPHADVLCQEHIPHMLASASSPSLLMGCGDETNPAAADIERHIHAHHIHQTNSTPLVSPQVQDPQARMSFPSSPLVSPTSEDPPPEVFLTPAPPRSRHSHERPNSAPPHHLEKISGTLLRLVGDHYLCCTCGRQLRTIGDQLTFETNIHHAISSGDLERLQNG